LLKGGRTQSHLPAMWVQVFRLISAMLERTTAQGDMIRAEKHRVRASSP
jgi:hypothetical protein